MEQFSGSTWLNNKSRGWLQSPGSSSISKLLVSQNLLGGEGEGVVEVLAEDGDQRLAEELIDADALAAAFLVGILAYSPTMEVESLAAAGEFGHADRVEPAGLGLAELAFTLKEASLDGAEAVAILIESGVGALFGLIHDRGHDVSVTVDGEKAFLVDLRAALRPHQF